MPAEPTAWIADWQKGKKEQLNEIKESKRNLKQVSCLSTGGSDVSEQGWESLDTKLKWIGWSWCVLLTLDKSAKWLQVHIWTRAGTILLFSLLLIHHLK